MNVRSMVIAILAATTTLVAGLVINESQQDLAQAAVAKQSIPRLAEKRDAVAKVRDCTLYGSGCLGDWTTKQHGVDGDPATADVLVAGDSIVNVCRPYLRKRLTAQGLTSVFDYWSGRPTEPTVTKVLTYSRVNSVVNPFKVVVMGTGTNDIMNPPVMAAQIERMKAAGAKKLIWGSVYASRSGTYSADLRNSGWVNNQIHASGLPVADWFTFLASYPGYRIGAYLPTDGIHPNYGTGELLDGSGCDAWALTYANKIVAQAKR